MMGSISNIRFVDPHVSIDSGSGPCESLDGQWVYSFWVEPGKRVREIILTEGELETMLADLRKAKSAV